MLVCGKTRIQNPKVQPADLGTAGCILKSEQTGKQYLLTVAHVLAPEHYDGVVGDTIFDEADNPIGKLAACTQPTVEGVDAAIVELTVAADPALPRWGIPTGWGNIFWADMELRYSGASSGVANTTVNNPNGPAELHYGTPHDGVVAVTLQSQVICKDCFKGGDSGAAILNQFGNLIGLAIGNSEGAGVVTPISTILEALKQRGFDLTPLIQAPADTQIPLPVLPAPPEPDKIATEEGPRTPAEKAPLPAPAGSPGAPPWSDAVFLGQPPLDPDGQAADVLAWTLWAEAASDFAKATDEQGLPVLDKAYRAVAEVVMNRVRRPGWWGTTIETVCLSKNKKDVFQFSCWGPGGSQLIRSPSARSSSSFQTAQWIADQVLKGWSGNLVLGSCNYYADYLHPAPSWADGKRPCVKIGHHLFFNDIP